MTRTPFLFGLGLGAVLADARLGWIAFSWIAFCLAWKLVSWCLVVSFLRDLDRQSARWHSSERRQMLAKDGEL